jgi:hypothetical protein
MSYKHTVTLKQLEGDRFTFYYDDSFPDFLLDSIGLLCSDNPINRAQGYIAIGQYSGFMNLDSYPLSLTESELKARWRKYKRQIK